MVHDNQWLEINKDVLEQDLCNAKIIGDCHYGILKTPLDGVTFVCPNEKPKGKRPNKKHDIVQLTKEDERRNLQIRKIRANKKIHLEE